jgi:hypothetical protein
MNAYTNRLNRADTICCPSQTGISESPPSVVKRIITTPPAPSRTLTSPCTQDFRQFVGEIMTVVGQEIVPAKLTSVVPGAALNAGETDLAVPCR